MADRASHPAHPQLPLSLGLKDSAVFDSFLPGPNREAVAYLQRLGGGPWEAAVYLWGAAGVGKSHLLQAVCHLAGRRGAAAMYLPLTIAERYSCEVLQGVENVGIVCIDDLQRVAGRADWEIALSRLMDRMLAAKGGLVMTGPAPPAELGLQTPQLLSRLSSALSLALKPLTEVEKRQALQLRAARRGLELSVEAGAYLVRHYGQVMTDLFAALETLDLASLAAQRRITIPFVRDVLGHPAVQGD
jgi:DnaA family protein